MSLTDALEQIHDQLDGMSADDERAQALIEKAAAYVDHARAITIVAEDQS